MSDTCPSTLTIVEAHRCTLPADHTGQHEEWQQRPTGLPNPARPNEIGYVDYLNAYWRDDATD